MKKKQTIMNQKKNGCNIYCEHDFTKKKYREKNGRMEPDGWWTDLNNKMQQGCRSSKVVETAGRRTIFFCMLLMITWSYIIVCCYPYHRLSFSPNLSNLGGRLIRREDFPLMSFLFFINHPKKKLGKTMNYSFTPIPSLSLHFPR